MSEPGRSSKAFTIREACGDDAAGMQQFLADLVAEKLPVVFRKDAPPTVDEERAVVEALAASPRSAFLIATVGPKVVGVLDFHGCTKGQRRHSGGFGVSVAKSWRRRGVATALIEHVESWARSKEFRRIELEVFENNPGAVSLYKKLGFEVEGRKRGAVEVDGTFVDVITMAKLI